MSCDQSLYCSLQILYSNYIDMFLFDEIITLVRSVQIVIVIVIIVILDIDYNNIAFILAKELIE